MDRRVRSVITLALLALVLVLAGLWGWNAISEPFPKDHGPPVCVEREVAKGDRVTPRDVTVSVQNASSRVGLAGLTMDLLTEAGFRQGEEGNTPGKRRVARVEIWTDDPRNPAVRLVASHLGDVDVVKRPTRVKGVLVVVGDRFDDLVRGKKSIRATEGTTICGPRRRAG